MNKDQAGKNDMKKICLVAFMLVFSLVSMSSAQIRPSESSAARTEVKNSKVPDKLPDSIEVEYRGGLYGYSKKEKGTIGFDQINERVIFFGKDGKEKFSVPFAAISVVHPSQKKVRSGTGRAVGAIPVPGAAIGGLFMKKKKNYLVIRFDDPDVDATGAINFLVDTEEILTLAVHAVGQRAEMQQRGDAYIRKKSF